jgi:uncharacterized phage protein gp47/JayE
MSNVPPLEVLSTGVSSPESVDIRQGILEDMNEAFGGDLDIVTPSTPQAYLADKLTDNIRDSNAAITYTVSQMDPAKAEGRMQDGIARIYFLERKPATSSAVLALCTGQPGVTLPAGSLAQDDDGNLWQSTGDAVFAVSGEVSVQFSCLTTGPITLGIGQLTQIAQLSPGWDAITNLGAATAGSNVESRAAFENRRRESVARNAHGTPAAIRSAVWDVEGVIDVFAYDNYTNAVLPYGSTSYPIAPHSIYIAVIGGEAEDIAEAIFSKKDLGCGMNGNTTVVVQDTDGYSFPYPEYQIQFEIPASLPVKFSVQLVNNANLPPDIIAQVRARILATFIGSDGSQRARIGGAIFASSYYAGVASISTAVAIVQIKVGDVVANLDQLIIGIDQAPTLDVNDITVVLV